MYAGSRSQMSSRQLSPLSVSRQSVRLDESVSIAVPANFPAAVQAKLKQVPDLAIMTFFSVLHGLSLSQVCLCGGKTADVSNLCSVRWVLECV